MQNMGIQGKIAIVTGASSGIGRSTAIRFAQEGVKVMLISRNERRLQQVAEEIRQITGDAHAFAADLSSEIDAKRVIEEVVRTMGGIDILVNAAGIIASGGIENTDWKDWDYMMNINCRSVFVLTQLALPSLIERRGNIVNVSSVTGLRAFPNVLAYCVSKAAVDQLTRCAALELASKGVRVNAVNPGVVLTHLHRNSGMDEKTYAAFLERSKETHPLGRVGRPEEIADLILFLASPHANWITGVTYSIDGGRGQTCAR